VEESGAPPPPAVENRGEEELFRAFLRGPGAAERFRALADRPGAAALLRTVVDLRNAMVEPGLLRAVKEDLQEDMRRLAELAGLMEAYELFLKKADVTTRAAISRVAARAAEGSRTAAGTAIWAVYGFYEFNGEQRDLLDAIVRGSEVTVYLPYREGRAWDYALRTIQEEFGAARAPQGGFVAPGGDAMEMKALKSAPPKVREEKLAGVTKLLRSTAFAARLFDPAEGPRKGDPAVPAVSCPGAADEMWYAAKEARKAHESEGVAWRDIGVICRTLEGRLHHAARFFREEGVPWWTPAEQPLGERPLAQMAAASARIALDDAYHVDVMAWFSSPLLREDARPDAWAAIARALGIVSGADWERLQRARGEDLRDADDAVVAPAAAVDAFAAAFAGLMSALPAGRGWAELADAWERFLESRLDTRSDEPGWRRIHELLASLGALDGAGDAPGREGFAAAFARALAGARVPVHRQPADGVALLDAMSARGQRFRVAFIAGLNEKEWPRQPREDPYLPDASRRRIAEATGCRLREKMAGVLEERLLFALALDCADRVVLVHRRTDEEGRKEAPSSFLDEVRRVVPVEDKPGVPRMPLRRLERKLGWLTWSEQRVHALLTGGADGDPAVAKAKALEGYDAWTEYDVLAAPPADAAERVGTRGLSPTALETLATCPFKYWAKHLRGLEPLDPLEAEEDMASREVGSVLHEALADRSGADTLEVAREVFRRRAEKRPPLRWAVWEAARDAGLRALEALVKADRRELEEGRWKIHECEMELPFVAGPEPIPGLHGFADRVETREAKGGLEFRVTDFKYRTGKSHGFDTSRNPQTIESHVLRDVAAGTRVQLAVYARLAAAALGPAARFAGSHYYFFGPRFEPVRLGLNASDAGPELARLSLRAWGAAAAGCFVVVDDKETCRRCDFRSACRRAHFPTRIRALADRRFAPFVEGRFP
jgi:hypothetical protein